MSIERNKYNINGQVDNNLSDEQAVALVINGEENIIHKIKCSKAGKFFNPLINERNYKVDALDKRSKSPMFVFRTVTKNAFDIYIQFLQRGHDYLLRMAERNT